MRRSPFALLFAVGVILTLLGSAHGYFVTRLVDAPALPRPWPALGRVAVYGLGALLIAHPITERTIGPRIGRILAWPAYVWLGACLYLLVGLWASDTALFAFGLAGVQVERVRALCVVVFAGAMVVVALINGLRMPAVRRVEVELDGWPQALDGYRIAQLSDVHIGSILRRDFARGLTERCNALGADLIAITGDLVDGSVRGLASEVAPFSALRARDGVYFVTGNHDHYSGADSWSEHLASLGMVVLRNRHVVIRRDGASFALAGVDDLSSRRRAPVARGFDLDAALAGAGPEPLVLLAHDPRTFEMAKGRGVALQLSGHTHDGQMWPFRYLVRLQTRWLAGLYRDGGAALYVSRGSGFWGPPMRVLAPAEITELVLRGA